jgi:hypothetical protein
MSQLSISAAALLVNKDRKTLYRLIKEGKLSATTSDSGARQVETTELLRVFGAFKVSSDTLDSGTTVSMPQLETPVETPEMALLKAELRHSKELLKLKDEQIADLRNSVRLLEFQPLKKKSWWSR